MVILLEYDNGWTHDDHRRYPLGIFTDEDQARQAAVFYLVSMQADWGWHSDHHCRLGWYTPNWEYGEAGPGRVVTIRVPPKETE